jgi:hypothetical protein
MLLLAFAPISRIAVAIIKEKYGEHDRVFSNLLSWRG